MNDFLRRIRRRPGLPGQAPADQPTTVQPAVAAPEHGAEADEAAAGGDAGPVGEAGAPSRSDAGDTTGAPSDTGAGDPSDETGLADEQHDAPATSGSTALWTTSAAPSDAQPTQAASAVEPGTVVEQPTQALAPVGTDEPLVEVHGPAVEGAVPGPVAPGEVVPAGTPAEPEAPGRPSFRERGRLRRRLRFLRRVRELGFRDLGGLVFDQHRFGRINEELVSAKLAALSAVDAELRALAVALDDQRPITELREPGISACPRCGALHGSEASFCPSCGTPFKGPRPVAEVGDLPTAAGTPAPAAEVPVWAAPNPPQ